MSKLSMSWTEKSHWLFHSYPKAFYPIRPLFTFTIGVALILFSTLNIFAVSFAIYLGTGLMTDDLVVYPFIRIHNFIENLRLGKKQYKSSIGSVAIVLGYVLGAILGFFVLPQIAGVM